MRVGTVTLGQIATFLILFSLLPISSRAAVFWDDELESGNTGYPLMFTLPSCGGATSGNDTTNKVSGSGSLRLGYPSNDITCGGFADRSFSATTDLWGRFYIRLSPGFIVSPVATKIMNNSTDGGGVSFWWAMYGGSSNLMITGQGYPPGINAVNYFSNVGNGNLRTSPEGGFVCVETRIKLNTVGSADGVIEAYKNGVLVMNHTGIVMRTAGTSTETVRFIFNRMYRQYGQGDINYDRLAFGNTRIGPIGGEPPPTPTVPSAPTGLAVT